NSDYTEERKESSSSSSNAMFDNIDGDIDNALPLPPLSRSHSSLSPLLPSKMMMAITVSNDSHESQLYDYKVDKNFGKLFDHFVKLSGCQLEFFYNDTQIYSHQSPLDIGMRSKAERIEARAPAGKKRRKGLDVNASTNISDSKDAMVKSDIAVEDAAALKKK